MIQLKELSNSLVDVNNQTIRTMTTMVQMTSADMADTVTQITTRQNQFLETVTLGREQETSNSTYSDPLQPVEPLVLDPLDGLPPNIRDTLERERMEEENRVSGPSQNLSPSPFEMQDYGLERNNSTPTVEITPL
jgi:hypothetical protein